MLLSVSYHSYRHSKLLICLTKTSTRKCINMSAAKYSNQELFTNSKQAEFYAKFRPKYSDEVFEKILSYCKEQGGRFNLAIDVGCGSGQSTLPLTKHFQQVIGIDVSEKQIANAPKDIENLSFQVSPGEDLGFVKDESVDLVTVAQAFHWMDQNKFYKEVTRALRPKGCLVIYGYGTCQLSHLEANKYFNHVYTEVLGPYWAGGRRMVEQKYSTINLPYPGWQRDDSLNLEMECTLDDFVGYMGSWSAVTTFQNKNPDVDIIEELKTKFKSCMAVSQGAEAAEENTKMKVIWPVFMLMGSKPK